MYDLPYHKERDEKAVEAFVGEHPFAFLTGPDAGGNPVATQVPLFLEHHEGQSVLRGHLMRNTRHHKAFAENDRVLAVFTGQHVYVSGSWYTDPHTPSTWNYMSVHVRGRIKFVEDDALVDVLRSISLHFEGHDEESPTIFDNLPKDLTDKLLHAIVAFEIQVDDIDTVFKLSQDRDRESYLNIITKLKDKGEAGRTIAAEMERRIHDVFPND